MNTLQMLYVCFLFLFIAVLIYDANVLSIKNEKLREQNYKLWSILHTVEKLTYCSQPQTIEVIRDHINMEIEKLLK